MAEYVAVDKEWLEAGLANVSDSIRGLLETEEKLEFPQGMKEAVDGFSLDEEMTTQDSLIEQIKTALQGKASGGGHINWMNYLLNYSFRGMTLPTGSDVVVKPEVTISTNISSILRSTKGLTRYELDYEFGDNLFVTNYFADAAADLEEVDFKGRSILLSGNCTNTFNSAEKLKRVIAILDFTNCTSINTFFNRCFELEEVRIASGSVKLALSFSNSSKLSADSIQSIIDGLADLTGGAGQTLTFHKDVKTKLTETQIATITGKNWTLA